jgi:hypothetical protein
MLDYYYDYGYICYMPPSMPMSMLLMIQLLMQMQPTKVIRYQWNMVHTLMMMDRLLHDIGVRIDRLLQMSVPMLDKHQDISVTPNTSH